MTLDKKIIKAKRATKIVFFICGLGLSSWAPMVPFVKQNLNIDETELGFLLLMLGLGALIMMPLSGFLMKKFGSRKVIAVGCTIVACFLPVLLLVPSFGAMLIVLLLFGSGIGMVDVAMNAHGIQVQNIYGKPIMSSLHGLFSVGGILGALGIGFLIKLGLEPIHAAIFISLVLIILILSQYKQLFDYLFEKTTIVTFTDKSQSTETNQVNENPWLNTKVLLLGFMCFTIFLSEGAMLDWSALFLNTSKNISLEFAGFGYACFSISMAFIRLVGDKIVDKLSSKFIVVGGCIIAVLGLLMMVCFDILPLILLGFVFLGIGASNIVPIFFSEGGKVNGVSSNASISTITTLGYAGQLVGPALLGFIAHHFSMEIAFITIAGLMFFVAIIYSLKK